MRFPGLHDVALLPDHREVRSKASSPPGTGKCRWFTKAHFLYVIEEKRQYPSSSPRPLNNYGCEAANWAKQRAEITQFESQLQLSDGGSARRNRRFPLSIHSQQASIAICLSDMPLAGRRLG